MKLAFSGTKKGMTAAQCHAVEDFIHVMAARTDVFIHGGRSPSLSPKRT